MTTVDNDQDSRQVGRKNMDDVRQTEADGLRATWRQFQDDLISIVAVHDVSHAVPIVSFGPGDFPDLARARELFPELTKLWDAIRHDFWTDPFRRNHSCEGDGRDLDTAPAAMCPKDQTRTAARLVSGAGGEVDKAPRPECEELASKPRWFRRRSYRSVFHRCSLRIRLSRGGGARRPYCPATAPTAVHNEVYPETGDNQLSVPIPKGNWRCENYARRRPTVGCPHGVCFAQSARP